MSTLTRDQIRAVFLAHGFTIKEGCDDLRPYVYEAADALIAASTPQQPVATLTISVEGSTTTIDCEWGNAVRALPPGAYPLYKG